MFAIGLKAQERVMTVHLKDGIAHQYIFNEIDSVTFVELDKVLPPIKEETQMMSSEMISPESCTNYYTLVDQYLVAQNKSIAEYTLESQFAGMYALMPLEKEKMVMLYGGGKYFVTKYASNHAEVLYDENLNPICGYSVKRKNAKYENRKMTFTIDLTGKEGVYYLRRSTKLSEAQKSSVIAIEEFTPIGRTQDVKILGTNISRFNKDEEKGTIIPISKNSARVSFNFTIDENVNIDAAPLNIANLDMVGNDYTVSIMRRAPETLKVRHQSDNDNVEKADAQELAFKSGFIIGNDTITRSLDLYKPLAGAPCIMLWLKGEEYDDEPTAEILEAHEQSLVKYLNYYISLEEKELILYDGDTKVTQVEITEGMTIKQLCEAISSNTAFKDFKVQPLTDENKIIFSLMQFPKIKLVGSYYQTFDLYTFAHIKEFQYHYDSFPLTLREAVDTTKHTFEVIRANDGVYAGIDGNFVLLDYDVIQNVYISDNITVSNIDVLDGKSGNISKYFSNKSRLSTPVVSTDRSPCLLGLMGHHVQANSQEGNVPNADSDVSSDRLSKICTILKEEEYKTLNMDELVEYMDAGMQPGKYTFFMFDDFRINALYIKETTRDIFINNGIKTNLALIQGYLWEGNPERVKGEYIQKMKELGWSCVSHSLRHTVATSRKPSVYFNYEIQKARIDCEEWGMNSEVYVYNWNGTWIPSDILLLKNGYKYAINQQDKYTTQSTNPYRMGRASFQEALPFNTIEKLLRWE